MDNCIDSRENGSENIDRNVRAGLYAIDLCKSAKCGRRIKGHMSENLLRQGSNLCQYVPVVWRLIAFCGSSIELNTAAGQR